MSAEARERRTAMDGGRARRGARGRGVGRRAGRRASCVRDGEVVARAANRTVRDQDPTAHAEVLAIRAASARWDAGGSTAARCT